MQCMAAGLRAVKLEETNKKNYEAKSGTKYCGEVPAPPLSLLDFPCTTCQYVDYGSQGLLGCVVIANNNACRNTMYAEPNSSASV